MINVSKTPLLDACDTVEHMRSLSDAELSQLADEVRAETIRIVSNTGGHLGAGLGVVELTVALHSIFNTPVDKLIWDVGHQSYPHKILTNRRHLMHTIRQPSGLAGFTKRGESEYDSFGAGHSSTSISAALGMAIARDQKGDDFETIAVIGDGAMSAGMAYEAMNNAGSSNSKLIVILNDNEMSIAPAVGAMSAYLSRMISSKPYKTAKNIAKSVVNRLPEGAASVARKTEQYAKNMATGGNFFEEMGFKYYGPIDGHNMEHLLPVLRNVRDSDEDRPYLIHVVTEKGKGFDSPEASAEKYHAVKRFDVATKKQEKNLGPSIPSYTSVFANTLTNLANKDESIVGITAAMPSGTGLDVFEKTHPTRMFDVGIAEQHAVTFAAGMACEGLKPFVAIYSTFLQRAYDQVVHDVAVQKLPVRFAIDRAGLVGADGPTHAGSFDITYLASLPHFVVMAASDENELARMVKTAQTIDDRPSAFRFPRGEALGVAIEDPIRPLEIGKGRMVKEGNTIALLSFGARLQACQEAASMLDAKGFSTSVADARFCKPLDEELIRNLAENHSVLITIEEGAIGGFSAHVMEFLARENLLQDGLHVYNAHLPDCFQDHGKPEDMYHDAGLDAEGIANTALQCLNHIKTVPLSASEKS